MCDHVGGSCRAPPSDASTAPARELAQCGATVLVHGRNQQRIDATVAALTAQTGGHLVGYCADFSSLEAERGLAADVAGQTRLDALVNNAGLAPRQRCESKDWYELTFAVSYLAPFLLTCLLLARSADPVPISNSVMVSWARLVVDCRAVGIQRMVKLTDALIAATAIEHG